MIVVRACVELSADERAEMRRRRQEFGMTTKQLSFAVGVYVGASSNLVAKWELGERSPTLENYKRWRAALDNYKALAGDGK